MCYNIKALCVNMFFIRRLWEDIMDKTIYEVLKTYDLPLKMTARIKLVKTDEALAKVLFDYEYAELVGEYFPLKESQRLFNEWKKDVIAKVDERLNRALGSSQKFSNATDYKNKVFGRIAANEELLIQGKIARRQKRYREKKDEE